MPRTHWTRIPALAALAACAVLVAPAQATAQSVAEVDIERDADALRDEIRPRPKDVDVADTLLVFTNTSGGRAIVRCAAYDASGAAVGRTRTLVPGNGVSYIRASDLSHGRDFVGHAVCGTQHHLIPSSIFLGPQIENLNVRVAPHEGATYLRFPLIATY